MSAHAQPIRAYLSKDRVKQGDELLVHVEVKGFYKQIRPLFPILQHFKKSGDTQQLDLQGGSLTIFSQAYIARDTGRFPVPSFKVLADQQLYESPVFTVHVSPAPASQDPVAVPKDISMEVLFERDTVFIGEQVRLQMVLMVPEAQLGNVRVSDFAKAKLREAIPKKSFWEEKVPRQSVKADKILRNGKPFFALPLFETWLFPLESGIFPFGDQYLGYELRVQKEGASTSDILLGKSYRTLAMFIKAKPKSLIVTPLPPSSRSTDLGVGQLQIQASLSREKVATGEPFSLEVTIFGKANFSTLPEPQFERDPGFTYESPSVDYQFSFSDSLLSGKRIYTYLLTAAYPGNFELGPIQYLFFDPLVGKEVLLESEKLKLSVSGKELPEILTNSEGSFYYRAFRQASTHNFQRISYLPLISAILGLLALSGLIYYFFNPKT